MLIYKYIVKKFFTTFLFMLGMFILIVIVFDISERMDNFIEEGPTINEIVFDYYMNFVPYFINLFSPLFIFIAVIYFTSRMAYSSEIVAILSAGFNYYKLIIPYILVGAFFAGISFYLNGWVIPKGNVDLNKFRAKYLKGPYQNTEHNIHRQVAKDIYVYMENFDYRDSTGYRFSLEKFENDKLNYKLRSNKVNWDYKNKNWEAIDYSIRKIDGLDEEYLTGDTLDLTLPLHPEHFGRKKLNIKAMTNPELDKFIQQEKMRGEENVTLYMVERYKRESLPFATIILAVMALSISSRRVRGGMGLHLGLGVLLAFSYIVLLQFSTTFAINAGFNPILSVWLPNIIYGILTLFLIYKAPK